MEKSRVEDPRVVDSRVMHSGKGPPSPPESWKGRRRWTRLRLGPNCGIGTYWELGRVCTPLSSTRRGRRILVHDLRWTVDDRRQRRTSSWTESSSSPGGRRSGSVIRQGFPKKLEGGVGGEGSETEGGTGSDTYTCLHPQGRHRPVQVQSVPSRPSVWERLRDDSPLGPPRLTVGDAKVDHGGQGGVGV